MAETLKERKAYAKALELAGRSGGAAPRTADSDAHAVAALAWEAEAIGAVVLRLLACGGGWLRMVPDCDGKVWCKWRYTTGRWEGYYSLAVCGPKDGPLSAALIALERKVLGASQPEPTHKPTPDRY